MSEEISKESIRAMRRSYGEIGLTEVLPDPIAQFSQWLAEAATNLVIVEANAMVLSTVSNGAPSSRTVLLKDVSREGFTFFTNYKSEKAKNIEGNEAVALAFPWYAMERQVLVRGTAQKVAAQESDDYFASRPWGSQIGAWASAQSSELTEREELEDRYAEFSAKYPEGTVVPRPDFWGGYLVVPTTIELWQGRYSRLHDRVRYIKTNEGWAVKRFYP